MTGLEKCVDAAGSLTEMGKRLGVSYQAVQNMIARGSVGLRLAKRLSAEFGVPMAELVDDETREVIELAAKQKG